MCEPNHHCRDIIQTPNAVNFNLLSIPNNFYITTVKDFSMCTIREVNKNNTADDEFVCG